jgi:hypothetical protein
VLAARLLKETLRVDCSPSPSKKRQKKKLLENPEAKKKKRREITFLSAFPDVSSVSSRFF